MSEYKCQLQCQFYSRDGCLYNRWLKGRSREVPPEKVDLGQVCIHQDIHKPMIVKRTRSGRLELDTRHA